VTLQQTQPQLEARISPAHRLRLRLKPRTSRTGHVAGAWWPHSFDLAAELWALLDRLPAGMDPVERVVYGLDGWTNTPARVTVGGRIIRLDGYRFQSAHTLNFIGANRSDFVLLIIPPSTDPSDAHLSMTTAAVASDTSTADELLGIGHQGTERRAAAQRALQRWDSDDGV